MGWNVGSSVEKCIFIIHSREVTSTSLLFRNETPQYFSPGMNLGAPEIYI